MARYKDSTRLQFRLNTSDLIALKSRSSNLSAIVRAVIFQFLSKLDKYPDPRIPSYTLTNHNVFISVRVKMSVVEELRRFSEARKEPFYPLLRRIIYRYLYKIH